MKLEINDTFTIGYFAKKHNKRIFRKGKWTELSREWVSKKGEKLFTYYDLTNEGYRTAKGQYTLIAVGGIMPNKHFCQGPTCHEQTTQDRFLKSRGVVRGRYAYASLDSNWSYGQGDKFFCSQRCKFDWLELNMPNIEQGRPVEFIRHRRESGGYEKVITDNNWGSTTSIERVDRHRE